MRKQKGQIVTVLTLIALGVMSVGVIVGTKVVQQPSPAFESKAVEGGECTGDNGASGVCNVLCGGDCDVVGALPCCDGQGDCAGDGECCCIGLATPTPTPTSTPTPTPTLTPIPTDDPTTTNTPTPTPSNTPTPTDRPGASAIVFPRVPQEFEPYTGTTPGGSWGSPWITTVRKCPPEDYVFDVTVCRDSPERDGFAIEFSPVTFTAPRYRDWFGKNFNYQLYQSIGGDGGVSFLPYEFGNPDNDCTTISLRTAMYSDFCATDQKAIAFRLSLGSRGFTDWKNQIIIFGIPPSESIPTETPTPTPTTEAPSCPFKATVELRDENNNPIHQAGHLSSSFSLSGKMPYGAFDDATSQAIYDNNLPLDFITNNAESTLHLPSVEGVSHWEFKGRFCETAKCIDGYDCGDFNPSCPDVSGTSQTISDFSVDCGAEYTYGWKLEYNGPTMNPTPTPTVTPDATATPTTTPGSSGKTYQLDWWLPDIPDEDDTHQGICWTAWTDNCALQSHEGGDGGGFGNCSQGDGSSHSTTIENTTGVSKTFYCDRYRCNGCFAAPNDSSKAECSDNVPGAFPERINEWFKEIPAGCKAICTENGISDPFDCPGDPTATPTTDPGTSPTTTPDCLPDGTECSIFSNHDMPQCSDCCNGNYWSREIWGYYCGSPPTATPTSTPTPTSTCPYSDCVWYQECSTHWTGNCNDLTEYCHDEHCCCPDSHLTPGAPTATPTPTPTNTPTPPPGCGEVCCYTEPRPGGDVCFEGNCTDSPCSYNVNCNYVPGCSTGNSLTCGEDLCTVGRRSPPRSVPAKNVTATMVDQACDGDGAVTAADYYFIMDNAYQTEECGTKGDVNRDCLTNGLDISISLLRIGEGTGF